MARRRQKGRQTDTNEIPNAQVKPKTLLRLFSYYRMDGYFSPFQVNLYDFVIKRISEKVYCSWLFCNTMLIVDYIKGWLFLKKVINCIPMIKGGWMSQVIWSGQHLLDLAWISICGPRNVGRSLYQCTTQPSVDDVIAVTVHEIRVVECAFVKPFIFIFSYNAYFPLGPWCFPNYYWHNSDTIWGSIIVGSFHNVMCRNIQSWGL